MRIDRELVSELLIRYVLSQQIVPHDRPHSAVQRVEYLIRMLIEGREYSVTARPSSAEPQGETLDKQQMQKFF
jgi:hypothetical protein